MTPPSDLRRSIKTGQKRSEEGGGPASGVRRRVRLKVDDSDPHKAQLGGACPSDEKTQDCADEGRESAAADMKARAERAEELVKTLRAHLERARAQVCCPKALLLEPF